MDHKILSVFSKEGSKKEDIFCVCKRRYKQLNARVRGYLSRLHKIGCTLSQNASSNSYVETEIKEKNRKDCFCMFNYLNY